MCYLSILSFCNGFHWRMIKIVSAITFVQRVTFWWHFLCFTKTIFRENKYFIKIQKLFNIVDDRINTQFYYFHKYNSGIWNHVCWTCPWFKYEFCYFRSGHRNVDDPTHFTTTWAKDLVYLNCLTFSDPFGSTHWSPLRD